MNARARMFAAEVKKNALLFAADPKPLAAGLIAPSMILIVFTLIFGSFSSLPLAFENNDSGEYGRLLEEKILGQVSPLGGKPYFSEYPEPIDPESGMAEHKIVGAVVIPENFSQSVTEGTGPGIEYYLDNSNSDFAKNLRLYLQEGIAAFYREYYPEMDARVTEILPACGQVEWVEVIASGSILLAAVIGGLFLFLYMFFKEREYGTLVFYSLTPRSVGVSLAARIFIAWCFSLLSLFVNIALALLLTGRNFFAALPVILPVFTLAVLVYIAGAGFVSLFVKKFYSAAMIVMFGSIIIWFISAGMNDIPETWDTLTGFLSRFFPNVYALRLVRNAVFRHGRTIFTRDLLVLCGMVLVMIPAFGAVYKRRIVRPPEGGN